MSESGHTPGEWHVNGTITGPRAAAIVWLDYIPYENVGFKPGVIWITAGLRLVAIVPRGEGNPDADAALIAATPDLLAGFREMLDELERDYGHGVANGYWPDMAPKLERWRGILKGATT